MKRVTENVVLAIIAGFVFKRDEMLDAEQGEHETRAGKYTKNAADNFEAYVHALTKEAGGLQKLRVWLGEIFPRPLEFFLQERRAAGRERKRYNNALKQSLYKKSPLFG